MMEQRGLGAQEAGLALEQPLDDVLSALGAGPTVEVKDGSGVWTTCRHNPDFPSALGNFPRESDVPLAIFGLGHRELLTSAADRGAIALVGARRASSYGREVAYSLAGEASARGLTVVSGMALGVDGAAHRGALRSGGSTIAVLAGGPDRPYPRSHRLLYEQILEEGCVISENPPGVEARRWAFVARNRIIAGISSMTVWVEGTESSGARHTFDFAEELSLPLGVVPGPVNSPMSAGPNSRLGGEGVVAVRGIDDIITELQLEPAAMPLPGLEPANDDPASEILGLIAAGERSPRALAHALPGLTPREISQLLGKLELTGAIEREPSGEYRRL